MILVKRTGQELPLWTAPKPYINGLLASHFLARKEVAYQFLTACFLSRRMPGMLARSRKWIAIKAISSGLTVPTESFMLTPNHAAAVSALPRTAKDAMMVGPVFDHCRALIRRAQKIISAAPVSFGSHAQ